jgi:prepilin-type processing-associated H-X9-DG protein
MIRTTRHGPHPRRAITYVEVLILIGVVALIISIVIPTIRRMRQTSGRLPCPSHLQQLGQALLLYANENKGSLPRTTYAPGPNPLPVWGTGTTASDPFAPDGPQPNDVSAVLFLLLRTQDITPEVFYCPSLDGAKIDDFGGGGNTAAARSNFTDVRRNLSYSIHNPYARDGAIPPEASDWWTSDMSATFAIAADRNPGTAGGDDNVLHPTVSSSATDMRRANSRNHDREGQNVLYGDGHVEFHQNPFVGVERVLRLTRPGRWARGRRGRSGSCSPVRRG